MLRFTGQDSKDPIAINIPYRSVFDQDLTLALAESITLLVRAVDEGRVQDVDEDVAELRWMKQFLIGFSILAIGEARSVIMLLSDGLSRNARVHMRALFEYELRTKKLVEDPRRALMFRDSIAFELRKLGKEMNVSSETVELRIAEALGLEDASSVRGARENAAFGGTVRDQMKDELWPEKRYIGTFAGMSGISHGSILALREVAMAVDGAGSDFLSRASNDGNGNSYLHDAAWLMLRFAGWIREQMGIDISQFQAVEARLVAANDRLRIVSREQEQAAADALAARER